MAILEVSDLSKWFGNVMALDHVSFAAEEGEIIGLLGSSGCGKTTLLRLLAGLEVPDTGEMTFDEVPLGNLGPQQRGFGLMFQELALFPHMNVFNNISFGLRMQKCPSSRISARVKELLEMVEMDEYANRRIHQLSGGERQRVALARSLAPAPKLLMLDEPLGSLDRVLRENLQNQVRKIIKEIGVTSIYVTHDRDEAFAMADSLVIMDHGKIVQTGTPESLIARPADEFVARSLGFKNILHGVVVSQGKVLGIDCPLGVLLGVAEPEVKINTGMEVDFLLEDSGISICSVPSSEILEDNTYIGMITDKRFLGAGYQLKIVSGGITLNCLASLATSPELMQPGCSVGVVINPEAVILLQRGS